MISQHLYKCREKTGKIKTLIGKEIYNKYLRKQSLVLPLKPAKFIIPSYTNMEYRELGHTNIKLSVITLGTFAMGGNMWSGTNIDESINAIHASLEHGVTSIDTAPFYGLGLSEEMVGKAIKGKDRSKIQILTKFGMVWDASNEGKGVFHFETENNGKKYPVYKYASKENVFKEVEESLRRLDTDYIDLLQLHWPDATTPIAETMEALNQLIDQGKILAAGVSNYGLEELKEAGKTIKLASNQVNYSMLNRKIENDVLPYTMQENISIIAYSPLERGLLTGKYVNDGKLKADDHRNNYFKRFSREKVNEFLAKIYPIAERQNVSLSQLVLRWTSLQPGITFVLAGARNAKQAIENAEAIQVKLTTEDTQLINDALVNLTK